MDNQSKTHESHMSACCYNEPVLLGYHLKDHWACYEDPDADCSIESDDKNDETCECKCCC
jgi:hypothetical protein